MVPTPGGQARIRKASARGKKCFTDRDPKKRLRKSHLDIPIGKHANASGLSKRQYDEDEDYLSDIPTPGSNFRDNGWSRMRQAIFCDGCDSCTLHNPLLLHAMVMCACIANTDMTPISKPILIALISSI